MFIWDDGSLEILNVTRADEGRYTCFAENDRGKANSTGSLIVTGKELMKCFIQSNVSSAAGASNHLGDSSPLNSPDLQMSTVVELWPLSCVTAHELDPQSLPKGEGKRGLIENRCNETRVRLGLHPAQCNVFRGMEWVINVREFD